MPRHSVKKQEAFTNTVPRNDVHVCHPELDSGSINVDGKQLTVSSERFNYNKKTANCSQFTSHCKCVAFTLAEVLITLTISGVVAALTMPGLITKYKKQIAVTHLKKAYSTISQAIRLSEVENGSAKYWDYPEHNYNGDELEVFYNKYFKKYIKSRNIEVRSTVIILKLEDGTELNLYNLNNNLEFYIFIPGIQKNIVYGKNGFYAAIDKTDGKLKLNGEELDRDTLLNHPIYGCNKNATHAFCTALIRQDGWEIKEAYPWDEL